MVKLPENINQIIETFEKWYLNDNHSKFEDYYKDQINTNSLPNFSKKQFLDFFLQFAKDGGMIQSGGFRTANSFIENVKENYVTFRNKVLEPFKNNFDLSNWLIWSDTFKFWGQGIATIYLNRIDKNKFIIVNQKSIEAYQKLGYEINGSTLIKKYNGILNAQTDLISKFPSIKNFYKADSLAHFLIGVEEGRELSETYDTITKKYWIYAPGENAELWDEFYNLGIMALGWDQLGNLNDYGSKDELNKKLKELYENEGSKKNDTLANYEFKTKLNIGDIVFVKKGRNELLGYGEVISDYYYEKERQYYKSCRRVKWEKRGNWIADHDLVLKTLTNITDYKSDHPDYEYYFERLFSLMNIEKPKIMKNTEVNKLNTILYGPPGTGKTFNSINYALSIIEGKPILELETEERVQLMERFNNYREKGQIEFVTFHANYSYEDFVEGLKPMVNKQNLLFELKPGVFKRIASNALNEISLGVKVDQKVEIKDTPDFEEFWNYFISQIDGGNKIVERKEKDFTLTHYDDGHYFFIIGNGNETQASKVYLRKYYQKWIKMNKENKIKYLVQTKHYPIHILRKYGMPFLEHFNNSTIHFNKRDEHKKFVIIIDEINRANISRVFGELITLIEPDKRKGEINQLKITLPSGEPFEVPSNLYIIGTMNTADKSIALVDIALRRRFHFVPMYPKIDKAGEFGTLLQKINEAIFKEKNNADFFIGHSFFMNKTKADLPSIINNNIIPLLMEYFPNKPDKVRSILNAANIVTMEDENHQLVYKS